VRILLWNAHIFTGGRLDQLRAVKGLLAHDVIVFTETKAPAICARAKKQLAIKGYTHYACTRQERSGGRRSGGVSIFIREHIAQRTREIARVRDPVGCESIWLRIQHAFPDTHDLLLGACYCSPQTSTVYRNGDGSGLAGSDVPEAVFGSIAGTLDRLRQDNDHVMIAGDFNARFGRLDERDLDSDIDTGAEVLLRPRSSCDEGTNAFGRRLVALCRECGLLVINGRVAGDQPAAHTFVSEELGRSTIDLFIASPGVFGHVRSMRVLSSHLWGESLVLSDHCPVLLKLNLDWRMGDLRKPRQRGGRKEKIPIFDMSKRHKYTKLFEEPEGPLAQSIRELTMDLGQAGSCDDSIASMRRILEDCAKRAFGPERESFCGEHGHAEWWNDECERAWHTMMQFRKGAWDATLGGLPPTAKRMWKALHKAFKGVRRDAIREMELEYLRQQLTRGRKNPRALWTWLRGGEPPPCAIKDIGTLTDYFRTVLNNAGDGQGGMRQEAHTLLHYITSFGGRGPTEDTDEGLQDWRDSELVRSRRIGAVWLNGDVAETEVIAALRAMRNNKSAGLEGVQAECYKYATQEREGERPVYVLAPYLHVLFNRLLEGEYPRTFITSALSPVFKRGDDLNCDNYRGIAVGGVLAKLYATVHNRRISMHCETAGLRNRSQAGCRQRLGTEHHLFTLRHLIAKHKAGADKRPLVVMQIDFSKAFDSVDHETLWSFVEVYGIHGRMLEALKASYADVRMRVKANGRLGPEFAVGRGVKQGCPLSVTLFGLFIEILAHYIDARNMECQTRSPDQWLKLKAQSADLGSEVLTNLLFVDDASLFATGHERACHLLELLDDFCKATGMQCNSAKCEVLVFGGTPRERASLRAAEYTLGGKRLEVLAESETTKYLGLHYGPKRHFTKCTDELLAQGRRAVHGLHAMCRSKGINVPGKRMELFNSLVLPVLSYGAQVWGPDFINVDFETAMANKAAEIQRAYMRAIVGARNPTMLCLFRELSQRPIQFHWAKLALRFWNALVKAPGTLCHKAFVADLNLAIQGVTDCWAYHMIVFLRRHGVSTPDNLQNEDLAVYYASLRLNIADILKDYASRLDEKWTSEIMSVDPREYPVGVTGVKACRYQCWMSLPLATGGAIEKLMHLDTVMPIGVHQTLMRFRLGCWDLEVNRPAGRTRAQRTCRACGDQSAVEDERHVFFECPCYEHIRDDFYTSLGFGERDMRSILTDGSPRIVAEYLRRVWDTRHNIVQRRARKRACEGDDTVRQPPALRHP